MKKSVVFMMAVVVMMAFFTGCSNDAQKKVEAQLAAEKAKVELKDALIAKYNELRRTNDGIRAATLVGDIEKAGPHNIQIEVKELRSLERAANYRQALEIKRRLLALKAKPTEAAEMGSKLLLVQDKARKNVLTEAQLKQIVAKNHIDAAKELSPRVIEKAEQLKPFVKAKAAAPCKSECRTPVGAKKPAHNKG